LDDKLVLDQWKSREIKTFRVDHAFTKGSLVKVRLEYTHGQGAASIQFGSNPIEKAADYSQAEELARRSDLVILTLGITPQLEGEQMPVNYEGFAGGDRTSILLPAPQRELLKRVASVGKPVVVVLTTGSAISLDPKLANGILLQWYSGEQGGAAVAEALVGETDPGGRLPVTFYRSDKDLPAFEDYHLAGRTYRYFKGKPLFPFGFGLSYTRFKYGSAKLSQAPNGYAVTVPVTNMGEALGDEVVEVYARYDHPTNTDPTRRLVGFKRVHLARGQTESVEVDVTNWALRSWDDSTHKYQVRPGGYTLELGPSSGKSLASIHLKVD
jgi:beta-glucosidase